MKRSGFKMKSPLKDSLFGISLGGTGVGAKFGEDKGGTVSFKPGLRYKNLRLKGNYEIGGGSDFGKKKIGGSASLDFGNFREGSKGFQGRLSLGGGKKTTWTDVHVPGKPGNVTTGEGRAPKTIRKTSTTPYTTGKLSIAYGSTGGYGCSMTGGCGSSGRSPNWNISGNVKHDFSSKSTSIGASGNYGWFSGGVDLNLKTKKPTYSVGVKLPLNYKHGGWKR